VFLASQSRLPFYLEPLAVPFSLLMARYLHRNLSLHLIQRIVAVQLVVLLIAKLMFGLYSPANDPRRLARAINAAAGDRPPNELVMVKGPRIQGLALYTHAQVEVISIRHPIPPAPRELNRHVTQSLEQELAEGEKNLMFLVPHKNVNAFKVELKRLGRTAKALGGFREFSFFRLEEKSE
jgi:hypothetical protein